MRPSVPLAFVICGTVLIAILYTYNAIVMVQMASAAVALGQPVNYTANLPEWVNKVSYMVAVGMIIVGTVTGLRNQKK